MLLYLFLFKTNILFFNYLKIFNSKFIEYNFYFLNVNFVFFIGVHIIIFKIKTKYSEILQGKIFNHEQLKILRTNMYIVFGYPHYYQTQNR